MVAQSWNHLEMRQLQYFMEVVSETGGKKRFRELPGNKIPMTVTSFLALPRPRLEVGANGAKSVETELKQLNLGFSVPSVDFVLLAPTSSPGAGERNERRDFIKQQIP